MACTIETLNIVLTTIAYAGVVLFVAALGLGVWAWQGEDSNENAEQQG